MLAVVWSQYPLVLLYHSFLCLLGALLEERERTSNLHDSHFDRELRTKATTLPASKDVGRSWLKSVSRQLACPWTLKCPF